ncbi:MAG: electron transfer flavoprotein subunit alpha/FixB family protein [Bacilli bacterium]
MKFNENAKDYFVFVEQRNHLIEEVSLELIGEASKLAKQVNYNVVGVLLGHEVQDLTADLIAYGCDKVIVIDDKVLETFIPETYTKAISAVINEYIPDAFFIGATTVGRDVGPRIAARVRTGLTADATIIEIDPENEDSKLLWITRPAFGGNLFGTIVCPDHHPQMATVRPGVLLKNQYDKNRKGEVINFEVEFAKEDIKLRILKEVERKIDGLDIASADIIVAGGRGVGSKENFVLLEEIAHKLGGVVAGSRAAVDAGWITKDKQVGQTGKTVRPKVYIACGISGSVQHVAGMDNAELIIAINKDQYAPIFEEGHVNIVGDLFEILPEVASKIEHQINSK